MYANNIAYVVAANCVRHKPAKPCYNYIITILYYGAHSAPLQKEFISTYYNIL